jgi:hypothetical protein
VGIKEVNITGRKGTKVFIADPHNGVKNVVQREFG